jgi:hypothetical protein
MTQRSFFYLSCSVLVLIGFLTDATYLKGKQYRHTTLSHGRPVVADKDTAQSVRADTLRISLDGYFIPSDENERIFWFSRIQFKSVATKHIWFVNGMVFTESTRPDVEPIWKGDAQQVYFWRRGKDSLIITKEPANPKGDIWRPRMKPHKPKDSASSASLAELVDPSTYVKK